MDTSIISQKRTLRFEPEMAYSLGRVGHQYLWVSSAGRPAASLDKMRLITTSDKHGLKNQREIKLAFFMRLLVQHGYDLGRLPPRIRVRLEDDPHGYRSYRLEAREECAVLMDEIEGMSTGKKPRRLRREAFEMGIEALHAFTCADTEK